MKKLFFTILALAVVVYVAYELLILYDNKFKFGRMWETPAVRPHEEKLPIMESGVVPFLGGEAVFKMTAGKDLKSPLAKGDPDNSNQGKALYFIYCAQCHGKHHDGNGTVGQSFHPLPTDLRSPKIQSFPEGTLFKNISYGTSGGRQPPLATTIDVQDRWRIIAYLKSLGSRK